MVVSMSFDKEFRKRLGAFYEIKAAPQRRGIRKQMTKTEILLLKAEAENALALETGGHCSFCAYHGGYACICGHNALYRQRLAEGVLKLLQERDT
jgi:hypothetical protein